MEEAKKSKEEREVLDHIENLESTLAEIKKSGHQWSQMQEMIDQAIRTLKEKFSKPKEDP